MLRKLDSVEVEFCELHGLERSLWAGELFDSGTQVKADSYEIIFNSATSARQLSLRRLVIDGKKVGWANQMIRLAHAIVIARCLKIPKVQLEIPLGFPSSFWCAGVQIEALSEEDQSPGIRGSFFYNKTFGPLLKGSELLPSDILRELSGEFALSKGKRKNPDALTVHIRSGDVYSRRKVHADYGQPPFAFIKAVLGHREWTGVTLVCEDERSPVLRRTEKYLSKRKISFRRVGTELSDALREIVLASNLVVSTGTFSIPGICMSTGSPRVYWFEENPFVRWEIGRPHARLLGFVEITGLYRKWVWTPLTNSPIQRFFISRWPSKLISSEKSK